MAEPHNSRQTPPPPPDARRSISRCRIDGNAGDAALRYGNSSMTTGPGTAPAEENRRPAEENR
jgi:hypothetical protein